MKKYLGLIVISLLTLVILLAIFRVVQNKTSLIPVPYDASQLAAFDYQAPIIIIGDQAASNLYRYKESLAEKISMELSNTIRIESLAETNQNLHRLLGKLKKMTVWPKLMIFIGGSNESYEKRIIPSELSKVNLNFQKYNNDWLKTIMMFYEPSSRLIYEPIKYYVLTEQINEDTYNYLEHEKTKRNELIFKLFKNELIELIEMSKTKGSELILLTTPVNLALKPLDSCNKINMKNAPNISEIRAKFNQKDYKTAFNLAEQRANLLIADPESYYLKGMASKKLGKRKLALESLTLANAYDCSLKRPNVVFNAIIKDLAKEYQVPLFDFHQFLYSHFEKNTLFFDDQSPQDLYMEKLTGFLARKIKIMLNI